MNEELKTKENEMLLKMLEGSDFPVGEVPLLLQEIVTYGIVSGALWIAVSMAFIFVSCICWKIALVSYKEKNEGLVVAAVFGAFIVGSTGIAIFLINIVTNFKAYFAPRLYLLDYARGLM